MYKKSSDQMNQVYAACSFWDDHINPDIRGRLTKQASALKNVGAGLAGGAAGYLTSGEKSSTKERLLRAAGGAALGAGLSAAHTKHMGKPKEVKSLLDRMKTEAASAKGKDKAILDKMIKLYEAGQKGAAKTASAAGAAVGAGVMGAYGGFSNYRRHKRSPGQAMSEAEFAAYRKREELNDRAKKGLKVSVLDRKLNELAVQEAQYGRQNLSGAVVRGTLAGAALGAVSGHMSTRGRTK